MRPLYIYLPAGQQRHTRKNIRLLGGRPLLALRLMWQVMADASLTGGTIVLSTGDAEIAAIGRSLRLTVDYMRPASLGTDGGSREVMLDVLDWADARGLHTTYAGCCFQPTSPLRTVEDVAVPRGAVYAGM